MQQRSGRNTVPQVFVGDRHLGGYDDISALDDAGELDLILAATAHHN
jgi:glutaredoxin 3